MMLPETVVFDSGISGSGGEMGQRQCE